MVPMEELERPSKPRRPWRAICIGIAVVVAGAALAYGLLKPAPAPPTAAGKDVPEFTLERLDGKGSISSEDLRGSPVVINFWASWCVPCKKEMPLFQEAWETYADQGILILGINLRDTPSNARAFLRKEGITYPVVADPGETFAQQLNVDVMPETFFVDPGWHFQGVLSGPEAGSNSGSVVLGAITEDRLTDQIKEMLAL